MSKYIRRKREGGYYFFTVVTYKRRKILTTPTARRCLRAAWKRVSKKRPFEVIAVCLLPDHLHCVWKMPEGDSDYSTRWRLIKTMFSRIWMDSGGSQGIKKASQVKKKELAVWQRRFWEHRIRDLSDLEKHVDYIHYNPIKHKLVERAKDWPWSSYFRYVQNGKYNKQKYRWNIDWMDEIAGEVE